MIDLIFLGTGIISFLGIICGLVLSFIAPEELNPGKKYFIIIHNIILTLILAWTYYILRKHIFMSIIVITILIFLFIKIKANIKLVYIVLFCLLFLSRIFNGFEIMASLIFLFGFPVGSLICIMHVKKKNLDYVIDKKRAIVRSVLYQNWGVFLLLIIFSILSNYI